MPQPWIQPLPVGKASVSLTSLTFAMGGDVVELPKNEAPGEVVT
jgi:hypothetical protein